MKSALLFCTALLMATSSHASELGGLRAALKSLDEYSEIAFADDVVTEINPDLLAALRARSGAEGHFHLGPADIDALVPPVPMPVIDALRPATQCLVNAIARNIISPSLERNREQVITQYICVVLSDLAPPRTFDLEGDRAGKFTSEYLRFLDAKNVDGSFRLAHLGLHIGALKTLAKTDKAQELFSQNTSLLSLCLYGSFKDQTWDILKHLPHLTHLDLSHGTCDEESVKILSLISKGITTLSLSKVLKWTRQPFLPGASLRPLGT